MAILHLILSGDSTARWIPELAATIQKHNPWIEGKKFLLVPYRMIGAHDVESGILGGYVEFVRRVHLNAPIPGAYLAEVRFHKITLESSELTSVQRRIQALQTPAATSKSQTNPSTDPATATMAVADQRSSKTTSTAAAQLMPEKPDRFLSPLPLDERSGTLGAVPNPDGQRCSAKGFLPMSLEDYLQLLDWTGRQLVNGKRGRIPNTDPPNLERLSLDRRT